MRQKLVQKHVEKIKLFEESIKSKETKRAYKAYFKKYMDYLDESKLSYLLLESDSKKIQQSIIDFILIMKSKGKTYAAIHNYVAAVFAFYKINDIVLNIDKISRFMPEMRKVKKDRKYEPEEIHTLLEVAVLLILLLVCL